MQFYNSSRVINLMVNNVLFSSNIWRTEFTFTHNNKTINEIDYLIELGNIKNNIVLDFGCGLASTAIKLSKEQGCKVYGLNISDVQIELSNKQIKEEQLEDKIKLYLYDGITIPTFPEKFDRIIYQESMCHVYNKDSIIKQLVNNLNPGGIIVGQDWIKKEKKNTSNIDDINKEWKTKISSFEEYKSLYEKYNMKVVQLIDASELPNNTIYKYKSQKPCVNHKNPILNAYKNGEFTIGFIKCIKI